MMIIDIKGRLREPRVLEILAYAAYLPTREKMLRQADEYENDQDTYAYGSFDTSEPGGVIVVRRIEQDTFEIISIAVSPKLRGKGIGSGLIAYAFKRLGCAALCAETDDDAVGFYRSIGFSITSLGEKYPGTVRYLCKLSAKAS